MKTKVAKESQQEIMKEMRKRLRRQLISEGVDSKLVSKAFKDATKAAPSEKADFTLKPSLRKALKTLVEKYGPLVVTGRKSLKVFTFKGYERMRASSKKNAETNKPWLNASASRTKKAAATTSRMGRRSARRTCTGRTSRRTRPKSRTPSP